MFSAVSLIWDVLVITGSSWLSVMVIIWLIGYQRANDWSVPAVPLPHDKKILVVFPHADDEALTVGGFMHAASQHGNQVTSVILTEGERGTADAHLESALREQRKAEAQHMAQVLGISQLMQENFGDGQLAQHRVSVKRYLTQLLEKMQPDIVITYDQAGLYGHPDHIVASELLTELMVQTPAHQHLWYISYPAAVLATIKLPEYMATDPNFKARRLTPTQRIYVGQSVWPRIRAIYGYRSQFASFLKNLPLQPWLPAWFCYSLQRWEYFAVVK